MLSVFETCWPRLGDRRVVCSKLVGHGCAVAVFPLRVLVCEDLDRARRDVATQCLLDPGAEPTLTLLPWAWVDEVGKGMSTCNMLTLGRRPLHSV